MSGPAEERASRAAPPAALGEGPRGLPAPWGGRPWCQTRESVLGARLRRHLGAKARVEALAPEAPVEAPLLLSSPEGFAAELKGRPGPAGPTGWLRIAVLRGPAPALVVALLEAGADDAVDEAEPAAALLARLRAHDRRRLAGSDAVRALGPWRFDPSRRRARHASTGAVERLTHTETAILRRLAMAGGAVVPDRLMLGEVLGYCAAAETHTLQTHVHRLRRKLEVEPGRPRLLLRAEDGYRLALGAA